MEPYNLTAAAQSISTTGTHDPVFIAAISAFSGVVIAYLTYKGKQRVDSNKAAKQPKDRMEQMFDGYERLIKQMAEEDERKARIIRDQQLEITDVKKKLAEMEDNLQTAQDELIESHQSKVKLNKELDRMRREYKAVKNNS